VQNEWLSRGGGVVRCGGWGLGFEVGWLARARERERERRRKRGGMESKGQRGGR
jgi:hypothetical protein